MERPDDAWQRAHHQASNWLRRYSDPWTRNNKDDLVQDVAIAAWRWARGVRHRDRFWAAVQTIATRVRARAMRGQRRLQVEQALVDGAVAREAPSDDYWTIGGRRVPGQHVRTWLLAAIERLKEPDRRLLLLFHEGFCCAELAERFHRTEACVKTRLHRARHRIRREVEAFVRTAGRLDG